MRSKMRGRLVRSNLRGRTDALGDARLIRAIEGARTIDALDVARSIIWWYADWQCDWFGVAESVTAARARTTTCTGGRLAALTQMDNRSSVPRDVNRYRTDSADVPRIRLHKRLLQRLVIGASFGICVSDSPIRTS
ncbi:hypothetical protein Poly51_11800 [Rubripirellula tenax]|uniref:Uncharacterized protein n=1 Tax=Rubripirellula tenax TaxID=2528015 RepID=A0A5C6FHD8_9BACT|nr:hypothetical protein Poly51_11800 [Rubripirellula tenax]